MSLPARERGLKQLRYPGCLQKHPVAPRAGAWIETYASETIVLGGEVAPRAGAWIETRFGAIARREIQVAPRAGAWIETHRCREGRD